AHVSMARRYIPSGGVESVVLFEAADRSLDGYGVSADWNEVADLVTCQRVPGNHFTMLREPNVDELAKALQMHLI
ncbi:MAG: hypothetical protein LC808_24850, partial [Actinobacteria bacterium]|nr:hypothetical protein [Actinomycetota bacterium]